MAKKKAVERFAAAAKKIDDEQPRGPVPTKLGDELEKLKLRIKKGEDLLKQLKARYQDLTTTILPEEMAKAGLLDSKGHGTFTLQSGAKVFLRHDLYVNVLVDDQTELHKWLKRRGFGSLVKPTVHHQALKSFCREQLENDKPLPPQVQTFFQTTAVIHGAKGED